MNVTRYSLRPILAATRVLFVPLLSIAISLERSDSLADQRLHAQLAYHMEPAPPTKRDHATTNRKTDSEHVDDNAEIAPRLLEFFERLDELGRSKVKDARFVELEFSDAERPERTWTEKVWLVSQDEQSIVVMKEDLIPWTYQRNSVTTVPSSWQPSAVRLKSFKDADFEKLCQERSRPEDEPEDEAERFRRSLRGPGPSERLLVAHAAWKKGLTKYCEPIVSLDPKYAENFDEYRSAVLDDLAWLHFLRGVNLLMYSERIETLPHLRLVAVLSPSSEFASQAKDLVGHLEKLVAEKDAPEKVVDESKLSNAEKAEFYVSQIKDLRCPQMSQPGFIVPYLAVVDGKPDEHPPTLKLQEMGMEAGRLRHNG